MQWYYAGDDGKQVGPLSGDDFNQAVTSGSVKAETLVWNEGMADWQPFAAVAEPGALAISPTTDGFAACDSCGSSFPPSDLVQFEGRCICASCKPAFFQRLREGGSSIQGGGTGQTLNADLMAAARGDLGGQWGLGVGFNLLFQIVVQSIGMLGALIPGVGGLVSALVSPAFSVGNAKFHLALARSEEGRIGMMFDGFKRFGTALLAGFLMGLYVFLWALLLIVPGIMAAYSYSMIYYIISDDPTITATEALARSKQMMYGNRMKLFCLYWRFFWWSLLCVLTLFIGFLWLIPYMNVSLARFYDDVRGLAEE